VDTLKAGHGVLPYAYVEKYALKAYVIDELRVATKPAGKPKARPKSSPPRAGGKRKPKS
jgi:hypothetical protein